MNARWNTLLLSLELDRRWCPEKLDYTMSFLFLYIDIAICLALASFLWISKGKRVVTILGLADLSIQEMYFRQKFNRYSLHGDYRRGKIIGGRRNWDFYLPCKHCNSMQGLTFKMAKCVLAFFRNSLKIHLEEIHLKQFFLPYFSIVLSHLVTTQHQVSPSIAWFYLTA